MDKLKDLAYDELQEDFEGLRELTLGSKEFETAVKGMTEISDRVIKMEELKAANKREEEKMELDKKYRELEYQLQRKQARSEQIHHWIDAGLKVLSIAVPAGITIWGANRSWTEEKGGIVPYTQAGKKFMDKLFKN